VPGVTASPDAMDAAKEDIAERIRSADVVAA
jgi:hypothetical protein